MLCGSADAEFYIDLGRQEDFYGAQYVCPSCVGHLGDLAGFPSPARVSTLERELAELKERNFELTRQLDGLSKVKDGLDQLGIGVTPIAGNSGVVFVDLEADKQGDGAESDEGEELGDGAGTPDESGDDEELGDVPEHGSGSPGIKLGL
jgi:hypothetical protein